MPQLILVLLGGIMQNIIKLFLLRISLFILVIAAWYVAYSALVSYVNDKINSLLSGIHVFDNPVWVSFASMIPDNLMTCVNLISQAFSLYLFFRIKHFILGRLTFAVSSA
ncbi:TPA: hypothetical protein ACIBS5_004715 [Salmonella enterica subsp. diarizonae serovar 60-67:z35:-]